MGGLVLCLRFFIQVLKMFTILAIRQLGSVPITQILSIFPPLWAERKQFSPIFTRSKSIPKVFFIYSKGECVPKIFSTFKKIY